MTQEFRNPFFKESSEYKRDFYPLTHYAKQASYYLHVMTGQSLEVCQNWFKENFKAKRFENMRDPVVQFLLRDENYNREITEIPLSNYLKDIIKGKEIMAPSLTTYKNVDQEQSMLAVSIDANISRRSVAKKAMFAYEAEEEMAKERGDTVAAEDFHSKWFFSEKTQTATKLSNNSVSGMHNSAANPFFNPSSHSTLTSNCRMTSGYGNANNEKLLSGNRHYWSPRVTICNIVSIIANTDYDKLSEFVTSNNFHIPSAEEVMEVIEYSSNIYWRDSVWRQKILDLVNKLNPMQRCAFVYTGDLYHIRKFNEDYIRSFIRSVSMRVTAQTDHTKAEIKKLFEDHVILAHHICAADLKGRGVKYEEFEKTAPFNDLYETARNISKTIHDYSSFIEVFLMTSNIPASVPRFPNSIRRSALISDTDSTIFTAQEWQVWFHGELAFHSDAVAVGATMIALASQSIGHVLAIMSANAGIATKSLRRIAMKNEFYFPVIVPTRVAKHYFGAIAVQEGNVKAATEYEIKGVHLKSSNAPPFITKAAKAMMVDIMETVMRGEKISMNKILNEITILENQVKTSLLKGEGTYYRGGSIKQLESYKNKDTPEKTNYSHFMMWQEVFAAKYGDIMPPPYMTLKVSTMIGTPTLTKKWLEDMKDQALADRIRAFMVKYNKKYFTTFLLPSSYLTQYGLPEELQDAIGTRHMVADVCKVFYIILETLGYYGLNSKETNLVMDTYTPFYEQKLDPTFDPLTLSKYVMQPDVVVTENEDEEEDIEEAGMEDEVMY